MNDLQIFNNVEFGQIKLLQKIMKFGLLVEI